MTKPPPKTHTRLALSLPFLRPHRALLFLLLIWVSYFSLFYLRILKLDAYGLWGGFDGIWADWPMHVGMVVRFVHVEPRYWFDHNLWFANTPLTYPFLINLISAMLIRLGLPFVFSINVVSFVCAVSFLIGAYKLGRLVLGSPWQSCLGINLFLLSSGIATYRFGSDLYNIGLAALTSPGGDYTRLDEFNWYTGSLFIGFFGAQRSFQLGIAIGVWGLFFFLEAMKRSRLQYQKLAASAVLLGLLPIVHVHTLLSVGACLVLCSIWFAHSKAEGLALFWILIAALLGTLYFTFLASSARSGHFFKWHPYWSAKEHGFWAWCWMWLKIWGPALPLAAFEFVCLSVTRFRGISFIFFASFWITFLTANFILIQPVLWDNSKIFFWCYLPLSFLMASGLSRIWRWKRLPYRLATIVLIILLTLGGASEAIRTQVRMNKPWQLASRDALDLAEALRTRTHPDSVFLTGSSHIDPIMMWAARPIFQGFSPWMTNLGLELGRRPQVLAQSFSAPATGVPELQRMGVNYVKISVSERNDFKADEKYYRANFPVLFENSYGAVYDVRPQTGK